MLTRRGLLQASAALAASPAVLADAGSNIRERRVPLRAVIVDSQWPDAQAFARAATARGMPVHLIAADLADVYCGQLAPRWRGGAAAVGGLTSAPALFYLERLAWDADMRLVFLGRHEIAKEAPPWHSMRGPRRVVDQFQDSMRVLDWHSALAHTLRDIPASAPALQPLSAVRDAMVAGDEALFSWVLAPITRRDRAARSRVFL